MIELLVIAVVIITICCGTEGPGEPGGGVGSVAGGRTNLKPRKSDPFAGSLQDRWNKLITNNKRKEPARATSREVTRASGNRATDRAPKQPTTTPSTKPTTSPTTSRTTTPPSAKPTTTAKPKVTAKPQINISSRPTQTFAKPTPKKEGDPVVLNVVEPSPPRPPVPLRYKKPDPPTTPTGTKTATQRLFEPIVRKPKQPTTSHKRFCPSCRRPF